MIPFQKQNRFMSLPFWRQSRSQYLFLKQKHSPSVLAAINLILEEQPMDLSKLLFFIPPEAWCSAGLQTQHSSLLTTLNSECFPPHPCKKLRFHWSSRNTRTHFSPHLLQNGITQIWKALYIGMSSYTFSHFLCYLSQHWSCGQNRGVCVMWAAKGAKVCKWIPKIILELGILTH